MNRSKYIITNSVAGLVFQILNAVLAFACRTVLIKVLGSVYLGVGGLFSNILSVLSLAELGIGSAMTYNLYKPLAEQNELQVAKYMNFYAKAYKIIGVIVTIIGLLLTPFLKYIIKDIYVIPNIYIIYCLYIVNTGISYLLSYKRTLFEASQRSYVISFIQFLANAAMNLLQIIVLLLFENYIIYFSIAILFSFANNLAINRLGNKQYQYLRKYRDSTLDTEERHSLFKHILAMMSHKIGSVAVNGTDNIIISVYLGLSTVGLYSNYNMIVNLVKSFINPVFNSFMASVGNLNALADKEKSYSVFREMYFVEYWINGFVVICFYNLFTPFITMWIGEEYLLSDFAVLIIICNYYVGSMRHVVQIYNTTLGLFWNDRYKPWIEAAVNLISSLYFVRQMGITGVFVGTLISTITVCWWLEPYLLYKHFFKLNVIQYYLKYLKDVFVLIIITCLVHVVCKVSPYFGVKLLLCILSSNIFLWVFYGRSSEYKNFMNRLKMLLKNK